MFRAPNCDPAMLGGPGATQLLRRIPGEISVTRAYVGNEFCQNLIPSRERLQRICHSFWQGGVEVTLVTPPVTDEGLEKLRPLFAWLDRQGQDVEVVFNDWGTLNLLHHEFGGLQVVQGRLLNKVLRDPRVTPLYSAPEAPEGIRAAMQPSGLKTPYLRRLLGRFGVKAIELDLSRQASEMHFEELPFRVGVYFPFGFVTTGRQCMIGSLHLEEEERFRPSQSCRQECRSYVTKSKFSSTLASSGASVYQRGNTFFYCPEAEALESFLLTAEACGVSRLIYQPSLPM